MRLADVARWAQRAREATSRRDEAIRAAREAGVPLRRVAEAAGLSHTAVAKIAARESR
jgi:hypothetical protein